MSAKEKELIIDAWNGLWYTYFFYYCDYPLGNKALRESLELCEEIGQPKGRVYFYLACMYQGMAEMSKDRQLFVEALEYYRQAFSDALQTRNNDLLVSILVNYVSTAYFIGNTKLASTEVETMRKYVSEGFIRGGIWELEYAFRLYQAFIFMEEEKWLEAELSLRKIVEIAGHNIEQSTVRFMIFACYNHAKALEKLNRNEESFSALDAAFQLTTRYDVKDFKLMMYEALSEYCRHIGDNKGFGEWRNSYLSLKDSLLNYRQLASVKEMSIYDELRQIDKEMAAMRRSEAQHHQVILIGGIVTGAVLILLSLIFINNRHLRKINKTLYLKNEKLLKAEEDHNRLLIEQVSPKEDRHRLSDNLNGEEGDIITKGASHSRNEGIESSLPASQSLKYHNSLLDEQQKDDILKKILLVMEETEDIYNPGFKGESLAALTDTNYKYVSQVINERCGCNFNTFLNEFRVKRACKLINTEEGRLFSIEGLANQVGFKSRNAFTSSFKKFTGLNPSEYLKIARSSHK